MAVFRRVDYWWPGVHNDPPCLDGWATDDPLYTMTPCLDRWATDDLVVHNDPLFRWVGYWWPGVQVEGCGSCADSARAAPAQVHPGAVQERLLQCHHKHRYEYDEYCGYSTLVLYCQARTSYCTVCIWYHTNGYSSNCTGSSMHLDMSSKYI